MRGKAGLVIGLAIGYVLGTRAGRERYEQIKAQAARIRAVAVDTHVMPLGNATKMTDAERQLLGAWIAGGAKIP